MTFNSYNAHVVTRFHVQLVDAYEEGISPSLLLEELNRFDIREFNVQQNTMFAAVYPKTEFMTLRSCA